MPKFSCRKLRETGQAFENFLLAEGLDKETNRECLRTIYNQKFKPRYGPARSLAPNRGPTSPPRPPRRAALPAGAGGTQLPRRLGGSWGGADIPSRAVPTPRPPGPADPCAHVPRRASRASLAPRRPGPGRGRAGTRGSCGRGDSAGRGGGARGVGVWASRTRGEADSWWRRRRAPARAAWHPRPLVEGLLQGPLCLPIPPPRPPKAGVGGRTSGSSEGEKAPTTYVPNLREHLWLLHGDPGQASPQATPSILWLKALWSPFLLPSKWKSKRLHSVQP